MALKYSTDDKKNFVLFSDRGTRKELNEIARLELNETPELKEECFKKLKMLLKEHCVSCTMDEDFLLGFLRTRKFEMERSFDLLKNYARSRAKNHKEFLNLNPDLVQTLLEQSILGILPFRDIKGRPILFRRLGIWKPNICSFEDLIAAGFPILNYLASDPMAQIRGIVIIMDNVSLSPAETVASIRYLTVWSHFVLKCFPVRYSQIHVLNPSYFLKLGYYMVKPLMSEKIKSRIIFHERHDGTLLEHIAPANLPEEFGGTNGPLSNDHLIEIMNGYLPKLKEEQLFFVENKSTDL